MKIKIFLFLTVFFSTSALFSQYITSFKVGMFSGGYEARLYNPTVYGYYNYLNVNQVIKYTRHVDNDLSNTEGGFYDELENYQLNVSDLISTLINTNGYELVMEREKSFRPAHGQQSDYEAEMTNPASHYPRNKKLNFLRPCAEIILVLPFALYYIKPNG
jgi:hypothetical protein